MASLLCNTTQAGKQLCLRQPSLLMQQFLRKYIYENRLQFHVLCHRGLSKGFWGNGTPYHSSHSVYFVWVIASVVCVPRETLHRTHPLRVRTFTYAPLHVRSRIHTVITYCDARICLWKPNAFFGEFKDTGIKI